VFSKRKQPVDHRIRTPVKYPSWTAVETETGTYLIMGSTKARVASERALQSWRFEPVKGSEESLVNFKSAGVLGFRNGSLIQSFATGKIYVIVNNKACHITDPDYFVAVGYDKDRIWLVSEEEVNLHELGEVLP